MKHLAIIPDGTRRWSKDNRLPLGVGYAHSLLIGETCCEWALQRGIESLTFYVFSTENWKRTSEEVGVIFKLLEEQLEERLEWFKNKGIKIVFLGRKERLPKTFASLCEKAENFTKDEKNLKLFFCLNYGGRDEVAQAISYGAKTEQEITDFIESIHPTPDLILRTGRQQRLSNFLLWQSAYAELMFIEPYFPELTFTMLDQVIEEYSERSRTYGGN